MSGARQAAHNRPAGDEPEAEPLHNAWLGGGAGGTAVAVGDNGDDGLSLVVFDREDNRRLVPILRDAESFVGTLRQRRDAQPEVELIVVRDGVLVGRVAIACSAFGQRGDCIVVDIVRELGGLRVRLEATGDVVESTLPC